MSQHNEKSRLGSLLIKKGLITQTQLDATLLSQITSGLRLGEALIEQGMLSERQLHKALKKQSRHRLWATIIAVVLGPMSYGAMASQSSASQDELFSSSQMKGYNGLTPMGDLELASIDGQQGFLSAQSSLNTLVNSSKNQEQIDSHKLESLDYLASLLNPITSMIDADISIKGVKNNPQKQTRLHADGSIELALPSKIEEIAFRNLRIKGDQPGRTLGDVIISNIRFSEQSSVRVRLH